MVTPNNPMQNLSIFKILLLLLVMLDLSACGQKGALYLPDQPKTTATP